MSDNTAPVVYGKRRGWYVGNHLPHCDQPMLVQHVTWHLADSVPQVVRVRLETALADLADDERARQRRIRYQEWLDAGVGSCVLRQPAIASLVVANLRHFSGVRYQLLAWVVMPNHVHALIGITPGSDLGRIVQSWKSFTARRINEVRRSPGTPVWHRDYWDRYIRDERHFSLAKEYIELNPVVAGLVSKCEDWPWSSAFPQC